MKIIPKAIIWGRPALSNLDRNRPSYDLTLYRLCEIGEELVGQFLGRTVDQALAELGQLAADLRLDVVTQKRAAVLVGERHGGAALGEACNPALALAGDLVAVRRIEIAQGDLAPEARRHRPDLHLGHRAKTVLVGLLQFLAAGDAGLQNFRIVQLGPHRFTACRKLDLAGHCHCHGDLPETRFVIPQLEHAGAKRKGTLRRYGMHYSHTRNAPRKYTRDELWDWQGQAGVVRSRTP